MVVKKRPRGRPRKIVQTAAVDSQSSSLMCIVGPSSRYPVRSRFEYNQGNKDTSLVVTKNSKKQALKFLRSERFHEPDLFPVRIDVGEYSPMNATERTSVANSNEIVSIKYKDHDDDSDDDNDDDDDDYTPTSRGLKVAKTVNRGLREVKVDGGEIGTPTARGLKVTKKKNRSLRQVKVDGGGIGSSMNPVSGNMKGRGAGNVATGRTLIPHSYHATEKANRARYVDDEIESYRYPISVNVRGYEVKHEAAPILEKILTKHGDIGRNCSTECPEARGRLVEMICSVCQKLEHTNLTDVTQGMLKGMLSNINLLESQSFDVKWLRDRVEDILNTKNMLEEQELMKEEVAKKTVEVAEMRTEVIGNRKRFFVAKAELRMMDADLEKVKRKNEYLKKMVMAYLSESLVDGLV